MPVCGGPCVYESASDDDYLMRTDKCPRGALITRWKKMSVEEPEQKGKIGLPEWLKVGNFVVFDKEKIVRLIEGYDVNQHTISIAYKNILGKLDRCDVQCGDSWGKARVVFPQPYTFETAPEILKARRKGDGQKDIFRLKLSCKDGAAYWDDIFGYRPIPFDEALQNWEQLDGWPCGTFDEEG